MNGPSSRRWTTNAKPRRRAYESDPKRREALEAKVDEARAQRNAAFSTPCLPCETGLQPGLA